MPKVIDPLDRLRELVERLGTQRDAAAFLGVSGPFVSDILKGNRQITPRILEKLGLEKVVQFRELR